MGTSRWARSRLPARVLVALALLVVGVGGVATEAGSQTQPSLTVSSPNTCLGPGATLQFDSSGWFGTGTVEVLAGGTRSIGTLPIKATNAEIPSYFVSGSLPLPANMGDIFSWTLHRVNPAGPTSATAFFDRTKWTCTPTLSANTTCLPPSGGSLTLTGRVNRSNQRIDVGFDNDLSTAEQPISKIIQNVGNTGPNGEINVTFTVPPLAAGPHTFYSGRGSFDGPFFWRPDDQSTNRDGSDVIVPVPITVPCPSAALSINPGAFDFGSVDVGSASGGAAFNVVNVGNIDAPISTVSLGGAQPGDFVVDSDGCTGSTLPAGGGCAVAVHFAPGDAGARSATLTVTSSNSATASTNLSGTGLLPPGLSINPGNQDFGAVPVNSASASVTFTVTNTGTAAQTVNSVSLTGSQAGQFAVNPDTCAGASLPGGGTCTVTAAFTPTGTGSRTAKLVVKSAQGKSATATLRGTGQTGTLGFDPNPADFGTVAIGASSASVTIKVTNSGGAALTISAVRIGGANGGDFLALSDSCTAQTLAPAATCTVDVLFKPTDAGDRNASLDVDQSFGTTSGALHGAGIFQAILKFTPPVVPSGSLATVVGRSFPPNTAIALRWQEPGIRLPVQVTTDANGSFTLSFVILVGERLGTRHLEPAPAPGVLEEPRPVAPLLVQAPTFRPRGQAIRSGVFNPDLISRG